MLPLSIGNREKKIEEKKLISAAICSAKHFDITRISRTVFRGTIVLRAIHKGCVGGGEGIESSMVKSGWKMLY